MGKIFKLIMKDFKKSFSVHFNHCFCRNWRARYTHPFFDRRFSENGSGLINSCDHHSRRDNSTAFGCTRFGFCDRESTHGTCCRSGGSNGLPCEWQIFLGGGKILRNGYTHCPKNAYRYNPHHGYHRAHYSPIDGLDPFVNPYQIQRRTRSI